MARGIERDKSREKEVPSVDLITPHGAEVTVGPRRAEALLKRAPIRLGDQTLRRYVKAEEGLDATLVDEETKTGAAAPRTGSKANTGGGA